MKIALVNNYYYLRGGAERVLFGDQVALSALGHEVRPFAHQDDRNNTSTSDIYFPTSSSYSTAQGTGLLKAAIDVVYSRSAGQAFAAFLDDFHPDVVHCHNIYGRLTTAILDEARRREIPVVMTVHDLKLVCPAYQGLRQGKPCQLCRDGGYWRCVRWKCHKNSRSASIVYAAESYFNRFGGKYDSIMRFLCPSLFMQQALIDAGISEERTTYHANALAVDDYVPQYEPGEYVLYVGRLSAEKGILTLVRALAEAKIPLHIAGTGPLEPEIRTLIAECNPSVTMEGFCEGPRLAALYRNAAFTVVPSEWYENASMSALESLAYGKAVLAADIGGNPELVIEGEVGRLFPSGNCERLIEVAREMWSNRLDLSRMGRRGRLLVERKFNQTQRASELISMYGEVCDHAVHPHVVSVL